ncbi:MAG: MFS transporter [Halioglobus sp.]|nr:MFS transporter [Halioglobus sp.]
MKSALMPVASLLLGVALLLTGQGLQGTLLPVRATMEAFSTLSIGVMGGAYFLGFTAGCFKGGDLVARVGHVRVFAAMTALASAAPLLHGLILEPITWTLLRTLTGFCFAVLYIVIESWLNEVSTNENRGMVFSTYVMITMSVFAIGQMMMLMYDPRELYLFGIVAVLISIAVVPVVMSTAPEPQKPHSARVNLARLFRISPAGTITSLCSGLTNGAFWSLAPAVAVGLSGDLSMAAWFMSANVVGGALSQWPIGRLSDRVGRRPMLIICAICSSIIAMLIVTRGNATGTSALVTLGFLWGAAAFPQYAIAVANTNDYADPSEYVMVSSVLLLMYGLGAIVGPLIASVAMTYIGDTGLYVHTGIFHLVTAMYIGFRATRRTAAPERQHLDFNESLVAASTTSQVYEEETQQELADDAAI